LPRTPGLPPERIAWRGADARRLSSKELSVVVVPSHGAKIASLIHIPSGRQWLAQPDDDLPIPVYGASFVDAAMCGWDEMLPTIDACRSPDTGARLPDHGEVWALPWRIEHEGPNELTTSVDGVALDYRLRRTLTVQGPTLRLQYELSTSATLSLLWAAHPQFTCLPGTTLHVAASEGLEVQPGPVRRVAWANLTVTDLPRGTSRKLYVAPAERVLTGELRDPDGTSLFLTWDVPYLGVWLDHARYAREPVIALEPSTGFYDELERASSVSRVPPERPLAWSLEVRAARAGVADQPLR
jgi:galactose mutarotase-like enzyme